MAKTASSFIPEALRRITRNVPTNFLSVRANRAKLPFLEAMTPYTNYYVMIGSMATLPGYLGPRLPLTKIVAKLCRSLLKQVSAMYC